MSDLRVNTIGDSAGIGPVDTLPRSGGSAFTLGPNWGALEFVSGANISNVTNIDVTSLAVGYDYIFSIQGAVPENDGVILTAQMMQSGSALSGASNYMDTDASTALELIAGNTIGNAADEGINIDVLFPEPNVADRRKRLITTSYSGAGTGGGETGIASGEPWGGRLDVNINACDGIRFLWSAGDWQALGKIYTFRRRLS